MFLWRKVQRSYCKDWLFVCIVRILVYLHRLIFLNKKIKGKIMSQDDAGGAFSLVAESSTDSEIAETNQADDKSMGLKDAMRLVKQGKKLNISVSKMSSSMIDIKQRRLEEDEEMRKLTYKETKDIAFDL